MPVFPSKEWLDAAIRLIHADPEAVEAGKGWTGDFGIVIKAEPGVLEEPFVVHLEPQDGRVRRYRVLDDPDDLDEIEPEYRASGTYSTWKGLLKGTLDPLEAVFKRQIIFQGELEPLVQRMRYRGVVDRVLAAVGTEFLDER